MKCYTAYLLTDESRNKLLDSFPPFYKKVIAHHITVKFGVPCDTPPPEMPNKIQVVGYINSGDGVEGLLVAIDGNTKRDDGSKYHITMSLNPDRKPVETNNYVDNAVKIHPIDIDVIPKTLS